MVEYQEEEEGTRLRPGRLSDKERIIILTELGHMAQKKYDDLISHNRHDYKLKDLKGSLKFEVDIRRNLNTYWLEGETEALTKLANYFEYGTGLHNTKDPKSYIKPIYSKVLKFKVKNLMVYAKKTQGVKPTFAFTRAVRETDNTRTRRRIRIRLGL